MMISAVIVNHRTSAYLPGLVQSLQREGVGEICVCDSFSNPEEREAVRRLAGVRSILLDDNPGYGASLNRGVRETHGEALLLMNADVELLPGSLRLLARALDDFDAAGPNFFWEKDCSILLPHPYRHSWKNELLQLTLPEVYRRKYLAHQRLLWNGDAPCPVDLLGGAAFLIRREAFAALEGFDEAFFLYFEENDFFHRLRDAGRNAAVVPGAHFIHHHDPSRTPEADAHYQVSKAYFEKKYFPASYMQLRASYITPPRMRPPESLPPEPIPRKGCDVLFSIVPEMVPCALMRVEEHALNPQTLLERLPHKKGFLGLADGPDVVRAFALD